MNESPAPLPEDAPDDPLTGHSYDGIQEYDNPLPGWWKWLFIATIAMSPPYFMYYHGGAEGRTMADRYDQNLAEHVRLQFAEIGNLPLTRESVIQYLDDDSWLRVGKSVFKTNCVSCHGREGEGLVGPNLTDDEYKNVRDIGDVLRVIQSGANGGAMPAWKTRLSDNELVLVASYAASLRGTYAAGGKDPEGRSIPPWPEPPAAPTEADVDGEVDADAESESGSESSTQPTDTSAAPSDGPGGDEDDSAEQ